MKPQLAPTARSRLPAHVWVRHDGEWRPGLLVNWERKPDHWWGSIARIVASEPQLTLAQARHLKPAETWPPPTS